MHIIIINILLTLCHFNTKFLQVSRTNWSVSRLVPQLEPRERLLAIHLHLLCEVATFVVKFICQLCALCVDWHANYVCVVLGAWDWNWSVGIGFGKLYKMPDKAQPVTVALPMKIESNARFQLIPCLNSIMPYGSTVPLNLLTSCCGCSCSCSCPSCGVSRVLCEFTSWQVVVVFA